jgi:hypothetical protein
LPPGSGCRSSRWAACGGGGGGGGGGGCGGSGCVLLGEGLVSALRCIGTGVCSGAGGVAPAVPGGVGKRCCGCVCCPLLRWWLRPGGQPEGAGPRGSRAGGGPPPLPCCSACSRGTCVRRPGPAPPLPRRLWPPRAAAAVGSCPSASLAPRSTAAAAAWTLTA